MFLTTSDSCLYVKEETKMIILLHVDDFAIAGKNRQDLKLQRNFKSNQRPRTNNKISQLPSTFRPKKSLLVPAAINDDSKSL